MYGEQFPKERLSQELNVPDFIRMVFRSKSKIAVTTLRALTGDNRRHNIPGVDEKDDPSLWQLISPKILEEIDWQPLQNIIEETGRAAMKIVSDTREVLATNPGIQEIPRRKAGESLEFAIATTSRPAEIHIYTNINGQWETEELRPETGDYEVTEYKDGTNICKITLPVDLLTIPGRYEYSGTVKFKDGTVKHLTAPDKNFKLEVIE